LSKDSNLNLLNIDSDASAMQIVESFSAYAYSSLTTKATPFQGESRTCIDQIWTNKPEIVEIAGICLTTYSDHFTTAALINLKGNKITPKTNNSYRKFSDTNINKFKVSLSSSNLNDVINSHDTNTSCDKFLSIFNDKFEQCFPLTSRVNVNNQ